MASGPNFPVFNFDPNWNAFVTETLSWLTDVMESVTGTEQRRSILRVPRKQIEYQGLYSGADRGSLDNALTGTGAHDWMLPAWWDQHRAAEDVPLGATFIPCDTTSTSLLRPGGLVLLRGGRRIYEVVEVEALVDDGIILKTGTTIDWPAAGVRIYPLQRCRFDQQPQQMRATDGTVTASFKFKVTEPDPLASTKFLLAASTALITNNLVARRFSMDPDGSVYDPNSGITVGQAAMARACMTAAHGLGRSKIPETAAEADRYQQLGQGLLDGIVGTGQPGYAILRRSIPAEPGQYAIPHWLYAARGPVGDLGDTAQGYELFPDAKRLRSYFASGDGAAYRDLFIALVYGRDTDTRGGDMRARWRNVNDAFMKTQMENRNMNDGREIFGLWKGLPPVLPAGAEPTGLSCFTTHAAGTPPNVLGVNAGNLGYNFLTRDSIGRIIFDVPDSFDITQTEVIPPSNNPPANNGQPPETQPEYGYGVPVLRVVNYARIMTDRWRDAQSYQSADGFLMADLTLSRVLDADESAQIGITYQGKIWLARWGVGEIITGSNHYFERTRFLDSNGVAIPVGQQIDGYFVSITAKTAYRATLGRMRLVVSQSREGDVQPFFPGANSFRTSGYNNLGLSVGYRGSPWVGGQTVDFWPMMAVERPGMFSGVNAGNLPIFDTPSRQTYYPLSNNTGAGAAKTPESLLAEQATQFILAAQSKYVTDSGGILGPLAHTFTLNRPDAAEFGSVPPFSWLYQNIRSDRDIFWQLRAIEGLASFCRLARSTGRGITVGGKQMTYNGKLVYKKTTEEEVAIIGFDKTDAWRDVYTTARNIVYSFMQWMNQNWNVLGPVTFNGTPIGYGGKQVVAYSTLSDSAYGNFPAWVDDPRTTTAPRGIGQVYSMALFMRSALFMRQVDLASSVFYDRMMVKAWQYLERYWQTTGDMKDTWSATPADMDWRHGEIITALSELLKTPTFIPAGIPIADVEARLVSTLNWLEKTGSQTGEVIPGMDTIYQGRAVLTRAPDEKGNMSTDVQRLTEDFDNGVSIPLQSEYTPEVFNRPQHSWWVRGREQHHEFRQMLYALRGRAVSFWKPTFFRDILPVRDMKSGEQSVRVQNTGYAAAGGPRRTREHVIFFMRDGSHLFRQIVNAVEIDREAELLMFGSAFRADIAVADIHRISFMDLVRMDQDGFQFGHITDTDGVSTSTTVMKSVRAA